ncbi:hypothetical protein FRB96_005898 [Tulasnella sp. 330]|nr:hypothetical protein FRB96_005898 [Tulasnella sp. 330]
MLSSLLSATFCLFVIQAPIESTYARTHVHTTTAVGPSRQYTPEDIFVGRTFLSGFDFFTGSDPTHGRVHYVDERTALKKNITYTSHDTFIMRADHMTVLKSSSRGRDSTRIQSKKAYGHGVMIVDIRSMPIGCGTWPALWSNSNNYNWPHGGEIDLIEGINGAGSTTTALHTGWRCSMKKAHMAQTGNLVNANCLSNDKSNYGCVVHPKATVPSFGNAFNAAGGGWYAVERTASAINVWHWPRHGSVPGEVRHAASTTKRLGPATWGEPYAHFSNQECDVSRFKPQNIIINLSLYFDLGDLRLQFGRTLVDLGPPPLKTQTASTPYLLDAAFGSISTLNLDCPPSCNPHNLCIFIHLTSRLPAAQPMLSSFTPSATFSLLVLAAASTVTANAARYYQPQDSFVGQGFYDGFEFFTASDPTHGRVNYVDQQTAVSKNLSYTTSNTIILRADSVATLNSTGPGRDSVRIQSKKAYGLGVTIANVRAMPIGCGTWPALWSNANGVAWPQGGEIDMIEGINNQGASSSVLHTGWNCAMNTSSMVQTGALGNLNCTSSQGNNAGCIVQPQSSVPSFGPNFNAIGGGWYAIERTSSMINMWFWARNDSSVPDEVRHAGFASQTSKQINPANWTTPYANFENSACDISQFKPQNIIINLTLCGDWAGSSYPSTCPKTCVQHVEEDASDFQDAAWNIASLTVWSPANVPTKRKVSRRSRHHLAAGSYRAAAGIASF